MWAKGSTIVCRACIDPEACPCTMPRTQGKVAGTRPKNGRGKFLVDAAREACDRMCRQRLDRRMEERMR